MTVTAIVCNHDYARYLGRCIESLLTYGCEVIVYDDGSTDGSVQVAKGWKVKVVESDVAHGNQVFGNNACLPMVETSHVTFVDSDNYLVGPPPASDADYTFADILVVDDAGRVMRRWHYAHWPLTARGCWDQYVASCAGKVPNMPFPWGGIWRTEFLTERGLVWRDWEITQYSADFRTALDWVKHDPTLVYREDPSLAFRVHGGQWTVNAAEQAKMFSECKAVPEVEAWPGC